VQKKHQSIVKSLIQYGANKNAKVMWSYQNIVLLKWYTNSNSNSNSCTVISTIRRFSSIFPFAHFAIYKRKNLATCQEDVFTAGL
jgi:hypothetical protein